ncbi:hypothetical protein [Brevibacillus laterosporus]
MKKRTKDMDDPNIGCKAFKNRGKDADVIGVLAHDCLFCHRKMKED